MNQTRTTDLCFVLLVGYSKKPIHYSTPLSRTNNSNGVFG